MRYTFLLTLACLLFGQMTSHAQILKTEADTAFLLSYVNFPPVDATLIPIFYPSMLKPNENPQRYERQEVDTLLQLIEEQPGNAALHWELAQQYAWQGEALISDYYTEQALEKAILTYESNKWDRKAVYLLAEIYMRLNDRQSLWNLWSEYTETAPQDARGWTGLAWLSLDMQGQPEEKIREYLYTAYEADPSAAEIYTTEYLYQLGKLIDKIVEAEGAWVDYWDVDDSFFQKAMRENPSLETPRMGFYALRLSTLMFESMLARPQLNNCFDLDKVWFGMTDMGKKQAEAIEGYMLELLRLRWKNKTFPLRCLAMLDILDGRMEMAKSRIKMMEDYSGEDRDMYKMLALGYFPSEKWDSAIHYLNKAQEVDEEVMDYLQISRLYFHTKNYDAAAQTFAQDNLWEAFEPYAQMGDFSIHYAIGAINLRMRQFPVYLRLMAGLHQAISQSGVRPQREAYYLWYVTITAIVVGDEDTAKNGLEQLRKSNYKHLQKWAEDLWYRFFI